jgi:hypothetical protein
MIRVGDEFTFFNRDDEDDPLNHKRVRILEVDDSRICEVIYGDTMYRVVSDDGIQGLVYSDELRVTID